MQQREKLYDVLHEIWKRQEAFATKVDPRAYADDAPIGEKEQYTINTAYHIIRELAELVDETNWKSHVKYKKPINKSNIIEEYIDVFKFFINLGLIWGISADDVVAEFARKSTVVEQKWEQENMLDKLEGSSKIVAVDIDGVLSEYPWSFVKWLIESELFDPSYKSGIPNTTEDIISAVGGYANYSAHKHEYRMSGQKLYADVQPWASSFLKELREMGYKVILLSARPYKKYVRIFADTLEWLDKHDLIYDAVLFDGDKEEVIINRFPQMTAFIDDEWGNIKKVSDAGFQTFWITKEKPNEFNIPGTRIICYTSVLHMTMAMEKFRS